MNWYIKQNVYMNLYTKKEAYINAIMSEEEQIVHTNEGDIIVQVGDYIITGTDGEQYVVHSDEFVENYELIEGTLYKTKPLKVWAKQLSGEITLESGLKGFEGDYFVMPVDSDKMYCCDSQTFESTYTLVSDESLYDSEKESSDNINNNDNDEYEKLTPSIGTIIRSIALGIVSLITILNGFGVITYTDANADEIYNFLISIITVIVAIRCWWKNNSFTEAAKKADKLMQELKDNESTTANG